MTHPFALHCFLPGQTIEAVIRLKGRHNLTKAEVLQLMEVFNEINEKVIPRPGMTFKIPLPLDAQVST